MAPPSLPSRRVPTVSGVKAPRGQPCPPRGAQASRRTMGVARGWGDAVLHAEEVAVSW